jgi:hypothetical protein
LSLACAGRGEGGDARCGEVSEFLEQGLVLFREGRALVAVDVELANDPAPLADEDH